MPRRRRDPFRGAQLAPRIRPAEGKPKRTEEEPMALLVPDGARSPHHRCRAKGCANVPEGDRIVCPVHAQLLRDAAERKAAAVPPAQFSDQEAK